AQYRWAWCRGRIAGLVAGRSLVRTAGLTAARPIAASAAHRTGCTAMVTAATTAAVKALHATHRLSRSRRLARDRRERRLRLSHHRWRTLLGRTGLLRV